MIEAIAAIDIYTAPGTLFIESLVDELIKYHFSPDDAFKIAIRMDINIKSFDATDPDWTRVIAAFAKIITDTRKMYGILNTIEHARKLSITF